MQRSVLPDVLRATAVMAMIANHLAVRVTAGGTETGAWRIISELGSFAPVLFFFTTGFGYGLQAGFRQQAGKKLKRLLDSAFKVSLLFAADAMLWLSPGSGWHLDFMAFIGIASAVVVMLELLPSSTYLASGLLLISLALRFVVGRGDPPISETWPLFVQWCVGRPGIDGVSYPLSPWIVFTLQGYLLGKFWQPILERFPGRLVFAVLSVTGVVLALSAYTMAANGAPYFRWGTMSLAYFIASLAATLVVLAGAFAWSRIWLQLRAITQIDGITSLAVVPIHYAVIGLLASFPSIANPAVAIALTLTAIIVSTFSARLAVNGLHQAELRSNAAVQLAVLSIAALSCIALLAFNHWSPNARLCFLLLGQLAIVRVFARRSNRDQLSKRRADHFAPSTRATGIQQFGLGAEIGRANPSTAGGDG
jgi:hypothetical protein